MARLASRYWLMFVLLAGLAHAGELAQLERRIRSARAEIQKLARPASDVRQLLADLKTDAGSMTWGVFRVALPDGPAVLKVYTGGYTLEQMQVSVLLQEALAQRGLAPAIRGILTVENTTRVIRNLSIAPPSGTMFGSSFGVLMEEVPGAWNFLRSQRRPEAIGRWNHAALLDGIRRCQSALDELRIIAMDTQFAIDENGRIWCLDLDHYWWLSPKNRLYGYGAEFERGAVAAEAARHSGPIPVANDLSETLRALQRVVVCSPAR